LIGRALSHYQVLSEISRGGMGIVYRALDVKLHREVALKVLPPELVADRERKARFTQEARAAASLEHPHIAVVYEIGEVDGVDFIAMELIRGEKLSDVLAHGRVSHARALEIAIEIAEGLRCAHGKSIVHRDIKPANIMVSVEGHAKIIDFGLAKLTERQVGEESEFETALRNETSIGVVMGTFSHMSPEQAKGEALDHRSDIFSFGVLLYELLVGALPFHGASRLDILHAIVHQPTPRLPRGLAAFQAILDRCLAKDLEGRFARMDDVLTALRSLREKQHRQGRWLAPSLAAAALASVILMGIFAMRGSRVRWAREEAFPEITRLASEDQYGAAFLLAQRAESYLGVDSTLQALWERISRRVSIRTEPPGADVYFRPFPDGVGDTQHLGRSPIENARVPMGAFWLTVEKSGFQANEALIGPWYPEMTIDLVPTESAPSGMVPIPAGELYVGLAGLDTVEPHRSPGYWVDESEVSNRAFKEFVDAGGYGNRDFWEYPIEKLGRPLTFEESRAEFRDQTGRPGPSSWEGGTYPAGRDDYPVSGVSWYEAAAFARFKGRSLPTIFHWTNATDTIFLTAEVLALANFDGVGPEPVTSRPRGPFGTRHMAGNVKEWCWNESDGSRYILGGAWNEPTHLFSEPDWRSPLDRSPENGFRTVLYLEQDDPDLLAMERPIARPTLRAQKIDLVDDALFAAYKNQFAYDPLPLDAVVEVGDESSPYWRKEKVSFNAAYGGERITAHLFLPRNVDPPFQTILYFPGSGATQSASSDDLEQTGFIDFVVMSGRAVLYPVYRGTYERRIPGLKFTDANTSRTYVEYVGYWVKDARRSLDYLESRPEIDARRMGYLGLSWGGRLGSIILAVDERPRAGVLLAGGFPHVQPQPEVAETNYAPRVKVPVLMLNGVHDAIFPLETNQKPMFELLGSKEKEHVLFETGHALPGFRNQMIKRSLDWFERHLGPVN
jgi:formylglycine-generating enzyme required for sulfatase activity/cephalosporin-C deacetylase-like acetyl esterase/predicted Ser/Thr protein kinase